MYSCCLTCRKWQGTKDSKYGDCHYIVAEILPRFYSYISLFGWKAEVPFDPHDVKYFPDMNDRLLFMGQKDVIIPDVVKGIRKEQDIKFVLSQYDGEIIGERTAPIRLVYFKTHKMKRRCSFYERTNG